MYATLIPKVCDECPVKDFKDNVLLNLGMELYNVTPDPDAILPYIIKDMPNLPTVSGVQVRVDATNEGNPNSGGPIAKVLIRHCTESPDTI